MLLSWAGKDDQPQLTLQSCYKEGFPQQGGEPSLGGRWHCLALRIKVHLKPCWSQHQPNTRPLLAQGKNFFFRVADTAAIHFKIIVAQIYRDTHRLSNLFTHS